MNTGGGSFDFLFERKKKGVYVCVEKNMENCVGIRLVPSGTLYFMTADRAIALSSLIQEAEKARKENERNVR